MKDKIKELAKEAGFCMWEDEPWNPGDVIDWGSRYDDELEKFAKLIIRECTNVLDELSELPDDMGGNAYLKAGSMKIKEHFGVE